MFKSFVRWILPLVVLLLIATYLVLSPVLATHAAAPQVPLHHGTTTQDLSPALRWRP